MFRERNATGECVRRCSLRLFREEPKTGSSSGRTFSVHEGASVLLTGRSLLNHRGYVVTPIRIELYLRRLRHS